MAITQVSPNVTFDGSSYSVFKPSFKKTIIDSIYQEVTSRTATYYHWFGKENTWTDFLSPFINSSTEDKPGQPSNNFRYDLHVRRDILTTSKIKPSDVSYVVPRINWKSNTVFDDYDDAYDTTNPAYSGATSLETSKYYVLTSDYNVYKCIWNNNNRPSTQMPTGTPTGIFKTSDGYKWKFMYSIPVSLRNRFLTQEYMPVSNALRSAYYSNGSLTSIAIENGGTGYKAATTYAVVTGDGYKKENPYIITDIAIASGGKGFVSTPTVTVSDPFPSAIMWVASASTAIGSYIYHVSPLTGRKNFYIVESGTILGTAGPTHESFTPQSESALNGNCQLRYVGSAAKALAVLTGDVVTQIDLTFAGFGYRETNLPTVTVSAPFTKDVNWTKSTVMILNKIVFHQNRYYRVTVAGTTSSSTGPTHTSGTAVNGTVTFEYLGSDCLATANVEKTNAEIELVISPNKDSVFRIVASNPGTKYAEIPTVTMDSPGVGTTATATCSVADGEIIDFTVLNVGNGYLSAPVVTIGLPFITVNASTSVTNLTDTITYNTHYFDSGDRVLYTNGGGTSIVGLESGNIASSSLTVGGEYRIAVLGSTNWNTVAGTTGVTYSVGSVITVASASAGSGSAARVYYINKLDGDTFRLTPTSADAINSTNIIAIAQGSGTAHKFTMFDSNYRALADSFLGTGGEIISYEITNPGVGYTNCNIQVFDARTSITFDSEADVDVSGNQITLPAHQLITGSAVTYDALGGTSIGGLTSGTVYYVIKIDSNTIRLATTFKRASSNLPIDITSDGSGEQEFTVVGAGIGAILVADFSIGDVETIQANVELLAVNGSIECIKVVNGGFGYGSANVEIVGDGVGATARAICRGGKIYQIDIINPGSGYSWTDVIITSTSVGAGGAVARAIMSPLGGHGSNAIDELNATNIVFYTSISRDVNQGFDVNNDYRKVGLIRNLKKYGSNERFIDDVGSGCILIEGEFNPDLLQPDMLLIKDGYKKYRIVDFNDTQILLSVFNNFPIAKGDTLVTDPSNGGKIENPPIASQLIVVEDYKDRTIDQFSGDLLFFNVRESYAPTSEQIITIRTTLAL